MRNILFLLAFSFLAVQLCGQNTMTIFDSVIFHDGYAALVTDPPPPEGVIKHRNDLFARKLTNTELLSIGTTLQMNVVISALCDNYDRIGNVNMALVPKDSSTYDPNSVQRIELGRFITPFFNKNFQPDTVPYIFDIDHIASLMKDEVLLSHFNIWIELEVFGVPYAANTQVFGCANRNDVFMGKLEFVTNAPASSQNTNLLLPLFFKERFNNYQPNATDTLGMTTKSITFNVPSHATDASLYLITSNHGANAGGEEYNRRFHYAYFDGNLELTYKPGRLTCEPFRVYNTQANGIYGPSPRTPAEWQSFSNWCPGDVIDIRQIYLDSVPAGDHTFLIRVPDAVFNGGEGNFPLSLYFQGKIAPPVASGLSNPSKEAVLLAVYPNPTRGNFTIESSANRLEIVINDIHGREINRRHSTRSIETFHLEDAGIYFVTVRTEEGTTTKKLVVY